MKYTLENNTMHIYTGTKYNNKPLSVFFDEYCISRPTKYKYFQSNCIKVQDNIVKQDTVLLHKDDIISITFPYEEVDWEPSDTPCKVLFENDFLFVVHKEAGLAIHTDKEDANCLNGNVARWVIDKGYHFPIRPIHRLDVDTSGLLIYSKIPFFQPWLDNQLSKKKITRNYLAISMGRPLKEGTTFTYTDSIGKDRHKSNVYRVSPSGKQAITTVKALSYKNGFQLFQCSLETGRTHQIRVHLSSHDYPIVNDPLYGHPTRYFKKMGLWANEIIFKDPITNKKHRIQEYENEDYAYFK